MLLPSLVPMEPPTRRVPVTIISGFLGAGKTTFLKRVLEEKHGRRILVIQNEFGAETGIEKATLINQDGGSSQVGNPFCDIPH